MNKKVAQVAVDLPVKGPFDYSVSEELRPQILSGQRVRILFNRRMQTGYVVGFKEKSAFKRLNPILSILDDEPSFNDAALQLAKSIEDYYGCSLGEALTVILPAPLRKNKENCLKLIARSKKKGSESQPLLTLIHAVSQQESWTSLIQEIKNVLILKQNILFLVPEVSGVNEIVSRLKNDLDENIIVLDKKTTGKKEIETWNAVKGAQASVVVGTRSAVFAPLRDLGLIVVHDEDHSSYKQEQSPHYRVHQIALFRQQIEGCALIFSSVTPSAETWQKAHKEKWRIIRSGEAPTAKIQIIDMTNYNPGKTSIISFPLQNRIAQNMDLKKKIILYINRRGFSSMTQCNQCGFVLQCQRCNVNLTYLYKDKTMVCRHCNFNMTLPKICPGCRGSYLRSKGTGVEKLESDCARMYPQLRIERFDKETKKVPERADVIIATEALMHRGHQLNTDVIALLNFDAHLNRLDFRSGHKAFALLVHMRQKANDTLVVQTRMRDNYALKCAQTMDFDKFYKEELKLRKQLKLPPFKHLLEIGLRGESEEDVVKQCEALFGELKSKTPKTIEVLDSHPSMIPKLRDQYRYTIMSRSSSAKGMIKFVKNVLKDFHRKKGVIITLNMDP